ncbi:ZIP family metal transporter [Cellvibrio sp. pealriver]|uniref:ZIP family metal transporter n=1 Tax=Cellvibrio sp. pealriver TaxID=1622269 RepID=UPI00066FB4F6|nr:ZIP family zinc transporter [Cellvibrio sp. pealriver]
MPVWLEAGFWGFAAASALMLGALLGWFIRFSAKTVAYVMAFGSGILLSALSFELVADAVEQASTVWVIAGFMGGALVFSLINRALNHPAKHRKRSRGQHPHSHAEASSPVSNGGVAIAAGTLLDGIPESIAIGLLVASGGKLSIVTITAIFISNIPEALSSTAGMRQAGRSGGFILRLWGGIALLSGCFAVIGALFFGSAPEHVKALISCIAAGGIFAMVVETMIPEAFAETHEMSGLVAALGFVVAIALQTLEM